MGTHNTLIMCKHIHVLCWTMSCQSLLCWKCCFCDNTDIWVLVSIPYHIVFSQNRELRHLLVCFFSFRPNCDACLEPVTFFIPSSFLTRPSLTSACCSKLDANSSLSFCVGAQRMTRRFSKCLRNELWPCENERHQQVRTKNEFSFLSPANTCPRTQCSRL